MKFMPLATFITSRPLKIAVDPKNITTANPNLLNVEVYAWSLAA